MHCLLWYYFLGPILKHCSLEFCFFRYKLKFVLPMCRKAVRGREAGKVSSVSELIQNPITHYICTQLNPLFVVCTQPTSIRSSFSVSEHQVDRPLAPRVLASLQADGSRRPNTRRRLVVFPFYGRDQGAARDPIAHTHRQVNA